MRVFWIALSCSLLPVAGSCHVAVVSDDGYVYAFSYGKH